MKLKTYDVLCCQLWSICSDGPALEGANEFRCCTVYCQELNKNMWRHDGQRDIRPHLHATWFLHLDLYFNLLPFDLKSLSLVLADRAARYWHHNVVCPSVRPSVTLCMCGAQVGVGGWKLCRRVTRLGYFLFTYSDTFVAGCIVHSHKTHWANEPTTIRRVDAAGMRCKQS